MAEMDECSGPPDECKPFAKKKQPKPKRRMKPIGDILDIKIKKKTPGKKTAKSGGGTHQEVRRLGYQDSNKGGDQDEFTEYFKKTYGEDPVTGKKLK